MRGFQPMHCRDPHEIFWKETDFPKLSIFTPPPQMARRLAVFQREACILLSCHQQKILEIAGKVSKKVEMEVKFPSTFQQSFSCPLYLSLSHLGAWRSEAMTWPPVCSGTLCIWVLWAKDLTWYTQCLPWHSPWVGRTSGGKPLKYLHLLDYLMEVISFSSPDLCKSQTWLWCPSPLMLDQD